MKLEKKILLFIILSSLVLFLFTLLFSYYDKQTQLELFIEKALAISYSFESSINKEILNNEYSIFHIITKYKYIHPELKSVEIYKEKLKKNEISISEDNLIINLPIEISGESEYYAKFIYSTEKLNEIISKKRSSLLLINFITLSILFIVINLYAKKFIISPINILLSEIEQIKKGNELKKSKITYDEIGILKKAIYDMYDEILLSKKKIEEHEKELEKKVLEKTKELQDKVKELERFQQITVNREMEMIELKKKLKELEELEKSKK